MTDFDVFLLALTFYGAGIFSAIFAIIIGRSIGRREARQDRDRYWRMFWE